MDAGAGAQLGEAAVDVYADLTRLDADLAEARKRVEAFAASVSSKMSGATMGGGNSALPTRQLAELEGQINRMMGTLEQRSKSALAEVDKAAGAVTKSAAEGVAKVDDATAKATQSASQNVAGLKREVDGLNSSVTNLNASAARAAGNTRGPHGPSPVNPPPAPRGPTNQAREFAELDRATESLARRYSPLHAAQIQYAKDLEQIDRLQKANIFSANDAAMFTDKATSAFKRAGDEQSKLFQYSKAAGEQIRRWAEIMAVAATAAGVIAIKSALDQAQAIKSTAAELNISTEAWQKWLYIASQGGVSAGQLETGFASLERVMGRAGTGAKKEAGLFEALGISLKDKVTGGARDAASIMPELADKLNRVGDANQKAAAMQILFGESAGEMGSLLAGGSEKINELSESAERLGIVLSDDQIQRADETAQKLEDVKNVLAANIAGVVADNANSIIGLASAIGTLTGQLIKFLNSNPQLALSLIGGLAGGMLTKSPWGAVAGALGGLAVGTQVAKNRDDQNMDINFRKQRLTAAKENYARQRRASKADSFSRVTREELVHQTALAEQAVAARHPAKVVAPKVTGPNIALPGLNAPKPPKGRKAAQPKKEPFNKSDTELLALQEQILRIAAGNTRTAADRAVIENQLLDIDKQQFNEKIEQDVHSKRLTGAQAEALKLKYGELDRAKRSEVEAKKQEQLLKESTEHTVSSLGRDAEMLEATKDLTISTTKRRDIELELFHLAMKIQKAKLDEVIASGESSAAQKKEAQLQKDFLDKMAPLREEALRRANMTAVEKFRDSIPDTQEKVDVAMDRQMAAKMENQRNRAVQFADDVADAFGNMTQKLLEGDPIGAFKGLLQDLAHTFQEEVLIRPMRDWARKAIGGPLAERVVGANAGPEGLSMEQLKTGAVGAGTALQSQLVPAAEQAAAALRSITPGMGGGGGGGGGILGALGGGGGGSMEVGYGDLMTGAPLLSDNLFSQAELTVTDFSSQIQDATSALTKNVGALGQFGTSLTGTLSTLAQLGASGGLGGGGGGGFLQTVLGIAGAAFGGGGLSLGGHALGANTLGAHSLGGAMGGFKDGGYLGAFAGGGVPMGMGGRKLQGPGTGRSDSILGIGPKGATAKFSAGEYIHDAQSTKKFMPLFAGISSGRIASMDSLQGMFGKPQAQAISKSFHIAFGDINVSGANDERSGRRAGKMAFGEIQKGIARTVRSGMMRRD